MANTEKVRMSWELKASVLTCSIGTIDVGSFDLSKIWNNFAEFDEVGRETAAYGCKQKLADSCARSKDAKLTLPEVKEQLANMWKQLSVDRKFTTGTRTGDGLLKHNQALKIFEELESGGLSKASLATVTVLEKTRSEWLVIKAEWEAKKQALKEAASGVEIPKPPEPAPVVLQSGNDKVKAKTGTNGKVETKRRARNGK